MDNKLQNYLDKKYWFMEQKFSNVSYLKILRRIIKDDWYDLWPVLFNHGNWKYESNQHLTDFLCKKNYHFLPEYQLANKSLIISDINASCQFSKRWIRQWWKLKWFDRKHNLQKQFQERLKIVDWEGWMNEDFEDQNFLLNFSIDELQTIYAWSMAFSQVLFLAKLFYQPYGKKPWFDQPGVMKRKQIQMRLLYLLQNNR